MKVLIGKKIEMTQQFIGDQVVPVTIISAGPCVITQVKGEKDGYHAIQVGYDNTAKRLSKSVLGHLKDLGKFRVLKEFRVSGDFERGKRFTVGMFKPGDHISVTSTSKGKGFQGVVKRHKFHGSPKTHGHKDQERMPGSIGAGGVQRVFKGRRMAGRMGGEQTTIHNLEIVAVDEEKNLLYVRGSVPGARHAVIAISGEGDMVFVENTAPSEPATSAPEISEAAVEQPATNDVIAEEVAVEQTAKEEVSVVEEVKEKE